MIRSFVTFPASPSLADHARLRPLSSVAPRIQAWELLLLIGLGIAAGCATQWFDLNLRIPGHAILRVVVPIALGAAIVPRRGAGMTVGFAGCATAFTLQSLRFGSAGEGAMTSLPLAGILFDFAASQVRRGWQLYAGFATAGLMTNFVAFGVKAYAKYTAIAGGGTGGGRGGRMGGGIGGGLGGAGRGLGGRLASGDVSGLGGGSWETWWPRAIVSYPLCGLLAGLICAAILFRWSRRRQDEKPSP